MKINTLANLETITNVPSKYLVGMNNNLNYIISDGVACALKNNDNIAEIDIGIGTLVIGVIENDLKYKFIPSDDLDTIVKKTVKTKESLLSEKLDKAVVSKFTHLYQELI